MANYSTLPKSFDDIKSYLITKLVAQFPTLGGFVYNSFLMIFIDLIAWAISLFMDYSDNIIDESRLFSAKNYENVRLQAAFFKYKASRKISARGYIRVGMNSNYNALPLESLQLRKYDRLSINGINFLIETDTTFSSNPLDDIYNGLPSGTYYVDIPVVQGVVVNQNKSARGIQSEEMEFMDDSIENSHFDLTVNGDTWTELDYLIRSTPTDEVYVKDNLINMSGVVTKFGDGFKGKSLASGDNVIATYVQTLGLLGQIKAIGFDVTFLTPYAYSDLTPVTLYGKTISQMIGASDVEDLEDVRYYGTISASSLNEKAFTDDEVKLALNEYGGILTSKSISETDINPDIPTYEYMNKVKLLVVPSSGGILDPVTKTSIRNYLRPKMDFTDFIEFVDPDYIYIRFNIDFDVYNNTPSDFSAQVSAFLETQYALGVLDFGDSVDHSEVTYKLRNQFSSYIKRFTLTLFVIEGGTAVGVPTYGIIERTLQIGGLNSPDPSIQKCYVSIIFTRGTGAVYTEKWVDNGSGIFIPYSGETALAFTDSYINYTTGETSLTLDPAIDEITKLEYEYRTYGKDGELVDIDIKENQIVRYDSAVVNIEIV